MDMNIFDDKIRVCLNSHGGVVFHFQDFVISNTIGGKWVATNSKSEAVQLDGDWVFVGKKTGHGFDYIGECYHTAKRSLESVVGNTVPDSPDKWVGVIF